MAIDISKNNLKKQQKQTNKQRQEPIITRLLGPGRGRILKSQVLVPGVQIEERERKIDQEKNEGWLSLWSKPFRAVSVQRTRNESQRPSENAPRNAGYTERGGKTTHPNVPWYPPRFPRARFNSLPTIWTPRSTIWMPAIALLRGNR